jgi:hypothetical protein
MLAEIRPGTEAERRKAAARVLRVELFVWCAVPGICPISMHEGSTHNLKRALLRNLRFASDTADARDPATMFPRSA